MYLEIIKKEWGKCKGFDWVKDLILERPYKPHGVSKDINYIYIFKEPVEFSNIEDRTTYRLVARHPWLAIDKSGTKVIDVFENTHLGMKYSNNYKYYYVYYPDVLKNIKLKYSKRAGTALLIHRLVALAWVENDDYVNKNIIDHIDGNKLNNHYTNLRWTSNSFNASLKSKNGYQVVNLDTGEIKDLESLRKVNDYLNLSKACITDYYLPTYRIINNNLYYICKKGDNVPVLCEAKPKINIIIVKDSNGKCRWYTKTKFANELVGFKYPGSLKKPLQYYLDLYKPGWKVVYEYSIMPKKAYAKNIFTNEIVEGSTVKELVDKLRDKYNFKHTNSPVGQLIRNKHWCKSLDGWVFSTDPKVWCSDPFIINNKPKEYKVVELDTDLKPVKVLFLKSGKEIKRHYRVDSKTVNKYTNTEKPIKTKTNKTILIYAR